MHVCSSFNIRPNWANFQCLLVESRNGFWRCKNGNGALNLGEGRGEGGDDFHLCVFVSYTWPIPPPQKKKLDQTCRECCVGAVNNLTQHIGDIPQGYI